MKNRTFTEFILLGFTNQPEVQIVIFIFLLLTYMLSVLGNLTIIILTRVHPHLQTPMYFFLRNFSFLEISFTSIFIPRFLTSVTTGNKVISFAGCLIQYFFAIFLGATEFYLLASMSYDRYVAICKPLHYLTIMSNRVCIQLVFCSWLGGFLAILPPIVISLSYGSCMFMYINPSAKEEGAFNKGIAVLITSITPLLNPFIYTLRNQQVKQAFKDTIKKIMKL
ncbi:olfactory receptor 6C4-like [Puma concolor]|uniref:Olfactory receptor n=1 Tax=Puma concolor TaxID=9696 RepID=A0A6P6I3G7_PUMCO|nr:olfactory receptor 6C4-like [Puma concolor]